MKSGFTISEAQKLLDEINNAIKSYDPALKPRAVDILLGAAFPRHSQSAPKAAPDSESTSNEVATGGRPGRWSNLGELFEAANPQTDSEKALAAGYYFQVIDGEEELTSRDLNDALKHLGHGVGNITMAIQGNISAAPALMRQTKKTGKTKQATKRYRVTEAGVKRVEQMVSGRA